MPLRDPGTPSRSVPARPGRPARSGGGSRPFRPTCPCRPGTQMQLLPAPPPPAVHPSCRASTGPRAAIAHPGTPLPPGGRSGSVPRWRSMPCRRAADRALLLARRSRWALRRAMTDNVPPAPKAPRPTCPRAAEGEPCGRRTPRPAPHPPPTPPTAPARRRRPAVRLRRAKSHQGRGRGSLRTRRTPPPPRARSPPKPRTR